MSNSVIAYERSTEATKFQEKYIDPIFLDFLQNTTVLRCGHSFSQTERFIEHIRIKQSCPCCRASVTEENPTNYLANELLEDGLRLAITVDTQAKQLESYALEVENLKDKIILDAQRASLIDIEKEQELRRKDENIQFLNVKAKEVSEQNTNLVLDKYELENQNKALSQRVSELDRKLEMKEQRISLLVSENKELAEKNARLEKRIEELISQNYKITKTFDEKIAKLKAESEKKAAEMSKKIEESEKKRVEMSNEIDGLKKNLTSRSSKSSSRKTKENKSICPIDGALKCVTQFAYSTKAGLEKCLNLS